MIPKINSSHGAETRNIINRVIEVLNQQGKSLQDLVAEGQLTEEQYAELLTTINGLVKSGNVDKSDLTPEFKGEIEGFNTQLAQKPTYEEVRLKSVKNELEDMSPNVLAAIEGGEGTTFDLLSIPQDDSVTIDKLSNELVGRSIKKQTKMSDYPCEIGVVNTSGANQSADFGIRTVGYIKVFAGTRVRLTEYQNHRLRVARYSLKDKTFIDGVVNLVNDYFVMSDCFIRITVTNNPTSVVVTNPSELAGKCFIDHRYLEKQPSAFNYQNETVTLSYNPDGTIKNVINDNGKERVSSSFSYLKGEIESITESIGQLSTVTTINRDSSGNVIEIRKTRGV